ncbi:MAG: S41 family peptidase [Peptostreptococcaceae bacterium]|nr:S41 family peptidase [Peptostreptococcaceae bacterium]
MISKKKMAIYSIALIIITALVTSVAVEYKYGEYKKLAILEKSIENDFYKKVDKEELINGALKGMFEATGDQYSQYYTKSEFEKLMEQTSGTFVGIGVVISPVEDENLITVVAPMEGSPAEKSGIKSGDKILKVNGEDVSSKQMDKALTLIKGKEGTTVNITIKRNNQVLDFDVKREKIINKTIEYKVIDDNIGYIKMYSFDEHTYKDFTKALDKLEAKNIKGLVIDLRDNPGGLLNICEDIADEILDQDQIIVSVKNNKEKSKEYVSDNKKQLDLPIALLINSGSASASEILTGAIVDNGKGIAVGTTTFGKGLVQTVRQMRDGTGFKLTTAQYYTPSGAYINGKGIKPTIEEQDEAKQLDVAVEWIKKEINKK